MLKRIKVEDLKEGMMFSEPLFFDDGKNRVLGKMSPVTQRELSVLKQWKVPFVMTAGKSVRRDTQIADLVEQLEELDSVDDEDTAGSVQTEQNRTDEGNILTLPAILTNNELYIEYLSIIQSLDVLLTDMKQKKPVPARPVDGIALKLRNLIAADKLLVIAFILSSEIADRAMAKALVDSAILTEVIASFLKRPDEHITELVIAALLHDCGMLHIPDAILQKNGALSDTEMQTVAAHTAYGYKTVVSEFMYTEKVALAVLQHHERWDGRGYPSGLNKENIDVGARILAVVDVFVAMTAPRPYRKALLGYDAMKTLLGDKGRRFDYEVIKAMIQCIGVYPIGSIVLMNDTSIARVIKIAPEAPLRPAIRILIDESGTHFPHDTGSLIDLREHKNTFIVSAVDPHAYQKK